VRTSARSQYFRFPFREKLKLHTAPLLSRWTDYATVCGLGRHPDRKDRAPVRRAASPRQIERTRVAAASPMAKRSWKRGHMRRANGGKHSRRKRAEGLRQRLYVHADSMSPSPPVHPKVIVRLPVSGAVRLPGQGKRDHRAPPQSYHGTCVTLLRRWRRELGGCMPTTTLSDCC